LEGSGNFRSLAGGSCSLVTYLWRWCLVTSLFPALYFLAAMRWRTSFTSTTHSWHHDVLSKFPGAYQPWCVPSGTMSQNKYFPSLSCSLGYFGHNYAKVTNILFH
jgi:hypothetical protein